MKKIKQKPHIPAPDTRKAIRKQKRQLKKASKQQHYLKKRDVTIFSKDIGKYVKKLPDSEVDKPKEQKKPQKQQISAQSLAEREMVKEQTKTRKLKSEMEKQRKAQLLKANEEEDKIISKLEKQLGLKKMKSKKNLFADDGLDYLLEVCDRNTQEQIVAAEKHLADVDKESDFEEDLAAVTGKKLNKKDKKLNKKKTTDEDKDDDDFNDDESDKGSDYDDTMFDDENDDSMSDDDEMVGYSDDEDSGPEETHSKPKLPKVSKKDNVPQSKEDSESNDDLESDDENMSDIDDSISDDDEISGDDLKSDGDVEEETAIEKPDEWEDIYGRKRDKDGNVIKENKGTYIPPHLRNKEAADSKELLLLKRQIKSVLNKLAGTNLHWACTSIEALYSSNSRNSVNTALSQLWTCALVQGSLTTDRMLAEHAALLAVLQANVGSEVGAHFVQMLVKRFDEMLQADQAVEDKTMDNLVAVLAYMYGFKLYHAKLLYEILAKLLVKLSEKRVDCVLAILRAVGGTLRKEEPLQLKTFIHETQAKIAKVSADLASGSRIKFLLEVLLAVKNNNLNKIPNYDPTYCEELKKIIKTIIRRGNYVTTLNIGLEDLLKADERGKWWVVGSAWEGNAPKPENITLNKMAPNVDQKLLDLARKQRMNTDVRRSIFCIIMAAEDYMDAFEKLQHLGLKGQQEREIVHVMLACCLQEKTFNPYYAALTNKLCLFDRKYQLSIQYAVWDKIKELENSNKVHVTNLAQLLIHLIMEKALPISVLKVIEFSDLNKSSVRFMRQILLTILLNADLQATLEVFQRISHAPKLHMFRESLRLFIQHFLIKNTSKKTNVLSEDEMIKLKERSLQVDKILTMHDSKVKF